MKLPRDVSASQLVKALTIYNNTVDRQKGSHIRLTTFSNAQHHITVPNHDPIKIGTLSSVLSEIATHFGKSRDDIIFELFGK